MMNEYLRTLPFQGGMGAYMGNTLLGTSPGMQRVGLLTRPPLNTALLGDPKVVSVVTCVCYNSFLKCLLKCFQ